MTYHKEHFNNVDRSVFMKALDARRRKLKCFFLRNGLHKEAWATQYS